MKNYAHRGFKSRYPENTMLAFEKSLEVGVDGIEFDVHLSKDGEVVIIHDETLEGTTNGKGRVMDRTLEELKGLDASHRFHDKMGVQEIPTLREYFDLVKTADIVTNIELKTSVYPYPGIEEKVLALIDAYDMKEKVLISSFNHHSILRMKSLAPDIRCALLSDTWMVAPGRYTKELGVECFHPVAYSMSREVVEELHEQGVEVNVWTGKEPVDFQGLMELGIDGIITDYPDVINTLLEKSKSQ